MDLFNWELLQVGLPIKHHWRQQRSYRNGQGRRGNKRVVLVKLHPKTIVATARGNVWCAASGDKGDKCDCFVDSPSDRETHEDFVVSVDTVGTALTAGANLKISAAADLSGSTALSEISLGKDPVQVKLQNPNAARVGIAKAQSYSYRCVAIQ
jgi:hypothetical protein